MLAPLLALMDRGPGTGVVVVLVTAAGAIASAWVLGWEAAGTSVAAAAALLLALSPAHVRLSRAVMSDVPASCLVGWLAVTAMAAKRHASAVAWAAVGLLTALSATVRPAAVLFLIGAGVVLDPLSCPRRMRSVAALGAGACIGAAPLLAWNAVTFGSPFSDGYHLWVRAKLFSLALLAPPVGGGTDPNIVHYAQALAGLGDLYPWPVAVLVALGLVEGLRRPGPTRTLCGLTLGFVVPLVIFQTLFFWQDTRFLLPALPLLCAVAAMPFASGEPASVRVSALALGALGGALLALTTGTYPPPKIFGEPATLRAIATRVEPNAAVLVRTNGAFFTRLVRQPGTDRL
jgi:4-amino-4-deoxy-L-arabinose transferase-like glycosyltransferase